MNIEDLRKLFKDSLGDVRSPHVVNLIIIIFTILKVRTVNFCRIAESVDSDTVFDSRYKRIYRFISSCQISEEVYARFIFKLLNLKGKKIKIAIDRTNWMTGKLKINYLSAVYCMGNFAFPLCHIMLNKKGNSNCHERIELMEKICKLYPDTHIEVILGDREFIGEKWFKYLVSKNIPFIVRVKYNQYFMTAHKKNKQIKSVAPKNHRCKPKTYKNIKIMGVTINLCVTRTKEKEILAVVSPCLPEEALKNYSIRWNIENFFQCMKSRGFNLEDTGLRSVHKLNYLFLILGFVTFIAFQTGLILTGTKKIKIKKHKRPALSIFHAGVRQLKIMLENYRLHKELTNLITSILSGKYNPIKNYAY